MSAHYARRLQMDMAAWLCLKISLDISYCNVIYKKVPNNVSIHMNFKRISDLFIVYPVVTVIFYQIAISNMSYK